MQIDLNNPENLTLAAVRQLIASASDDEHTQLRVTKAGIAYISSGKAVGGVDTDGLSSSTMMSRHVPGLYFIGEVVDVTGWLGGYNFQWAWASGHAAGTAIAA